MQFAIRTTSAWYGFTCNTLVWVFRVNRYRSVILYLESTLQLNMKEDQIVSTKDDRQLIN